MPSRPLLRAPQPSFQENEIKPYLISIVDRKKDRHLHPAAIMPGTPSVEDDRKTPPDSGDRSLTGLLKNTFYRGTVPDFGIQTTRATARILAPKSEDSPLVQSPCGAALTGTVIRFPRQRESCDCPLNVMDHPRSRFFQQSLTVAVLTLDRAQARSTFGLTQPVPGTRPEPARNPPGTLPALEIW
jgi:hypothetical protein